MREMVEITCGEALQTAAEQAGYLYLFYSKDFNNGVWECSFSSMPLSKASTGATAIEAIQAARTKYLEENR